MFGKLLTSIFLWAGKRLFPVFVVYAPGDPEQPRQVRALVFCSSPFHLQQFCQEFLDAGPIQVKAEDDASQLEA